MVRFKHFFDKHTSQINLPPGEYEGPLIVTHSCTIDGSGATLWSGKSPVLTITASDVTVRNLRIELTNASVDKATIAIKGDNVKFHNVEIFGGITGLKEECSIWNLPRVVNLGSFAADKSNDYLLSIKTGASCGIISEVSGLSVSPTKVGTGEAKLKITIEPLRDKTSLYGSILFKTDYGVIRRIYVTGQALKNAAQLMKDFEDTQIIAKNMSTLSANQKPLQSNDDGLEAKNGDVKKTVSKGQRVIASNASKFEVIFEAENIPQGLEIDACAFCLRGNKQVSCDDDFVYFSNPCHESRSVDLIPPSEKSGVIIFPSNIPQDISSIAVCFSIYDESNNAQNSFKQVSSPRTIVLGDGKVYFKFPMELEDEKIVTALEFYRHKDQWKINFIGAGYAAGLRKLCESYGLEVV